jgi:uncharacterized membrane protein
MTEGMPPTRIQIQNMQRALTEKVLDKACSDSQWKQQFIEDPELAMRNADFPEIQELQQASQPSGGEVQGQSWGGGWGGWGGGGWGGWGGGGWGGPPWWGGWWGRW